MLESIRKYDDWKPLVDKILNDSKRKGFEIRLTGGLAIHLHCEKQNEMFELFRRKYADVDLVCLNKDIEKVRKYFAAQGFEINEEVYTFSEGKRLIFENKKTIEKLEVFVDELDFCHKIDLRERFVIDYPTISVSDLLLSKMQIVKISEKDLQDLSVLIIEHELSDNEQKDSINIKYIAKLLSKNWGFYFTFINNIKNIIEFIGNIGLTEENKWRLIQKLNNLKNIIMSEEKNIKWKFRAFFGKRIKWYKAVSEI